MIAGVADTLYADKMYYFHVFIHLRYLIDGTEISVPN